MLTSILHIILACYLLKALFLHGHKQTLGNCMEDKDIENHPETSIPEQLFPNYTTKVL